MMFAPDTDITLVQQFLASGVAATGLTVTAALYKDGVAVGGHGSDATAEIGTTGLYVYTIDELLVADPAVYTVVFITSGTADQKRIAQQVQVSAAMDSIAAIENSVGTDLEAAVSTVDTVADGIALALRDYPGVDDEELLKYDPIGAHLSNSLGGSAESFTTPPRADGLWLQVTVQNAYYTLNGTTPTSSVGFLLTAAAAPVFIPTKAGDVLKVLRATSGAILQRQYVRVKSAQ